MFCARGAIREFLEKDKRVPLLKYAQNPKFKEDFMHRMKRDGLAAPFQWFKAFAGNVSFEDESRIEKETLVIDKPVLFLACKGDFVSSAAGSSMSAKNELLPNLEVKEIDSAHWCPLEKPEEVGQTIVDFLQRVKF